jgi:DNA-3-methyladenine glycosylase
MDRPRFLCSGPARLTQAFAIARADDGTDLVRNDSLFLLSGEPLPVRAIARSTRVGVSVGIERRWRYFERGSAFVSPGRPSVPVATGAETGIGATGSRGS